MADTYPSPLWGVTAPQFRHPSEPRSNLTINSKEDDKPVLINSRDYVSTTGTAESMQCKPNLIVGGAAASLAGAEFSPRVADGIAAFEVRGLTASPFLKGTTGNIGSNVVGIEVELDLGAGMTRTITGGVHALRVIPTFSVGGTYTGGKSVIKLDDPNQGGWDHLINIGAGNVGAGQLSNATASLGAQIGQILVKVGTTVRCIPYYATS
jgi:hypothetical protein